jgi:preprotein translocase subunit SecE
VRATVEPSAEPNTLQHPEPAPVEAQAASGGFLAASVDELRKVVWPSRQQLFSETVAVILMVGLSAAVIAAIDRFYGWGSSQVFR